MFFPVQNSYTYKHLNLKAIFFSTSSSLHSLHKLQLMSLLISTQSFTKIKTYTLGLYHYWPLQKAYVNILNLKWKNNKYLENGKCSWPDILPMYFSQLLEPCDQLEGGLFRLVFLCNSWNHAGVSMFAYFTTAVDLTWLTANCRQFCNHAQHFLKQNSQC